MAMPAFMKKAFSRDGGDGGGGKKSGGGAAGRLAKIAAKNDNDGDEMSMAKKGGKGKKMPFMFGKKKGGAMQAAALRFGEK